MADELTLTVGGRDFGGWQDVSVTRSIEAGAGTFDIGFTEHWPGRQADFALGPGDACEVRLGADLVIKGYIDTVAPSYTSSSHALRLTGRDATGDLVDCSAVRDGGQWKNRTAAEIAADLAKPYGVKVTLAAPPGDPFKTFALSFGESAFEAIERACRQRALLPVADGAGGLVLTRATTDARAATALIWGRNIKEASAEYSALDRYSEITVKGQRAGDDNSWPSASTPVGKATDSRVARFRNLIVVAESPGDDAKLTARAVWEARVRAGRARRAEITVVGWRERDGGALWRPNTLVPVRDPWLAIDGDMLIAAVTYRKGEGGTTAALTVTAREAYDVIERREDEPGW